MVSRAASGAAVGTANSSSSRCTGCAGEPGSVCAAGILHARASPEAMPEGLRRAKQVQSWEQPRAVQR